MYYLLIISAGLFFYVFWELVEELSKIRIVRRQCKSTLKYAKILFISILVTVLSVADKGK